MANCRQACPYNTLDGCKVKEYNAICPLTNMVTPITEYKMTNADRIRSMSDEELRNWLFQRDCTNIAAFLEHGGMGVMDAVQLLDWLQQPAE